MPPSDCYPLTNITSPGTNDILCGRGGGTNAHPGNIKFRKLVAAHKLRYLAASKSDKPGVARDVVKEWRSMNPPGRFLAKMDSSISQSGGLGDDERRVLWYDVGDKKAREKASQCLRERNGAANEAVAALVKTVTSTGEACPEDYATLMNKAALVKAQNELTFQQQNEMIKMGRQQQQQQRQNAFEPISLQQQQQSAGNTEDDMIEAEIQRLLQQRQQQLMAGGGLSGDLPISATSMSGGVGGFSNANGSSNNNNVSSIPQPYMGEESIMREYNELMEKQKELNMMAGMMGANNCAMNMGGMMPQAGNDMMGIVSMQPNHNPDAAKDYMNRLRMLRQGDGGNNEGGMGVNSMPDQATSSAGFSSNHWKNGDMGGNMNTGNMQNMQGNTGRGPEDFTIEEYQASLQQFLSHDDDVGNFKTNAAAAHPDLMMSQNYYQCIQVPTNLEDGGGNKRGRRGSLRSVDDMDLPRTTFKSVGSAERPSFQSMDDLDIRGTFRSVDTMDMMSIGNSIDEIMNHDIKQNPEMSKKYGRKFTANNNTTYPTSLNDFAHLAGESVEIRTMDHGQGNERGGQKKVKKGGMTQVGTTHMVQTKSCDGPSTAVRGSQLSIKDLMDGVDEGSRMSFGNM